MIKHLRSALFVLLLAGLGPVAAAPLVFDLNCIIGGGNGGNGTCTPSASYGTITIADNGNAVTVTVNLVGVADPQRVQKVYLNFAPALDETGWSSPAGLSADEDSKKPGPYATSMDLEVPGTGNLGFEPQVFDILKASLNLDPSMFDYKDAVNGLIYAAVHIGACGPDAPATCAPGQPGENSIWVGARDSVRQVPEPGSMALAAIALLALAFARRLRVARQSVRRGG